MIGMPSSVQQIASELLITVIHSVPLLVTHPENTVSAHCVVHHKTVLRPLWYRVTKGTCSFSLSPRISPVLLVRLALVCWLQALARLAFTSTSVTHITQPEANI
jgi:hypothetical protein